MRVRLLADVRLYWNYAVQELKKGTEHLGDLAKHLLDNAPPGSVEVLEQDPAPEKEPERKTPSSEEPDDDPTEPPGDAPPVDGTIDALMKWVGDSPERAAAALEAEKAKDKPRSTVVKRLIALVDADED